MIDVETSEKVVLILYVILSVACSVAVYCHVQRWSKLQRYIKKIL